MSPDTKLLHLYMDGELSPAEAEAFRARLRASPNLRAQLQELRRVGAALRTWSSEAEMRAGELLEPTLRRANVARRLRTRHETFGYALAAALVLVLPGAPRPTIEPPLPLGALPPAAIERVEATDPHARVFAVGSASTPVVWLVDDEVNELDPG